MEGVMRFLKRPVWQSDGQNEGGGSFTEPVFDDEYYGRDQAGGKGRTIGLAVGVIVGAIIAGTAAWFVFGPGGGAERGQTPLIAAEPEPFKVRPADPGGLQVENQDKLVYERLTDGAPKPGVENILPPPETPKVPVAAPESAPVEPPSEPEVTQAPISLEPPSPAVAPEVTVPEPEQAIVESEPTQPEAVTAVQAEEPTPAAAVAPAPAPTSTPTPAAPTEGQTLENMVAALSGDYLIQIAALRSQDAAQGEWDRISGRHSGLLGSYRPVIVRADLGERGIFYRLRAGPLPTRGDAEQLCSALAAENVGCLVVRNE